MVHISIVASNKHRYHNLHKVTHTKHFCSWNLSPSDEHFKTDNTICLSFNCFQKKYTWTHMQTWTLSVTLIFIIYLFIYLFIKITKSGKMYSSGEHTFSKLKFYDAAHLNGLDFPFLQTKIHCWKTMHTTSTVRNYTSLYFNTFIILRNVSNKTGWY
jgi:hypothetical protein